MNNQYLAMNGNWLQLMPIDDNKWAVLEYVFWGRGGSRLVTNMDTEHVTAWALEPARGLQTRQVRCSQDEKLWFLSQASAKSKYMVTAHTPLKSPETRSGFTALPCSLCATFHFASWQPTPKLSEPSVPVEIHCFDANKSLLAATQNKWSLKVFTK